METKSSGNREDPVTGAIEAKTAYIPSSGFLALALGSIAASAIFRAAGKKELALFVGQWAPTILLMGVYNKLVKLHGSDGVSNSQGQYASGSQSRTSDQSSGENNRSFAAGAGSSPSNSY